MKKNELTKEELERDSTILNLLLTTGLVYTKQELMNITGMNERAVRSELENIAKYYPVRATAGRKGYSILRFEENSTYNELKEVNNSAYDQIREIENRISSLKMRLKPLIAIMRVSALKLQEYEAKDND